ncbi:hypothetical protein LCGC14_2956450 [marine sediment metagenome]|uniref:Uncharacterized protein n=1 Tax=marine sediment metagenome TaxID=412755 RepID=A0A0F8Y0U1_9ZZZZ
MRKLILFTVALLICLATSGGAQRGYRGDQRQPDAILDGFNGIVPDSIAACVDSTDSLYVATIFDSYLNRKLIGWGTGSPGKIRISGVVKAPAATEIGKRYFLGINGAVRVDMHRVTGQWIKMIGRCSGTGELLLQTTESPITRVLP